MATPFDIDAVEALQGERSDAQALRALAAKEDLAWLMGDARGRRFVHGLLADAGVYRSSMASDAQLTAYNEGARGQGLKLMLRLQADTPGEMLTMIKESLNG